MFDFYVFRWIERFLLGNKIEKFTRLFGEIEKLCAENTQIIQSSFEDFKWTWYGTADKLFLHWILYSLTET